VQIDQNIPLAPLTTLRIGGPARYFAQAIVESDLLEAMRFAQDHNLPLFPLGAGSNLLVADAGYPGLVLHLTLTPSILRSDTPDAISFKVSAGTDWDVFVAHVCEQGISGVECLAGIPGLVGSSPIQNIGAYGQEVSQTIDQVRALDLQTSAFVDLSATQCQFAYRSSIFNSTFRGRYLITSVRFRFSPHARPTLNYADLQKHFAGQTAPTPSQIAAAVREIRAAKGMYLDPAHPSPDHRSAGSFFKNPVVPAEALTHIAQTLGLAEDKIPHWPMEAESPQVKLPAAWLIEQAGFPKGFTLGPVAISSRHTLALINRTGDATCADLLRLRDTIALEVSHRFHIDLEQEPVLLR
jgi:UDP-N-acetylmuramate dehydrogenase